MIKIFVILILIIVIAICGFNIYSLRKDLQISQKRAVTYEARNDNLQKELIYLSRFCRERERIIEDFKQSVFELESSINLDELQRHIPKKTWNEIKPVIDRIRSFKYDNGQRHLAESNE